MAEARYQIGWAGDYASTLSRAQGRYKTMLDELTSMKTAAATEVPSEYNQLVGLYQPGGAYGAGAIERIQREAKYGTSQGMANLARTGMSSGNLSAGVAARSSRQAQEQIKQVEDTRYEKLGGALTALAAAKEARGMRMSQAYQTAASLVGGYQEPSQSEYSDPYAIAKLKLGYTNLRVGSGSAPTK